jgi:hypothetical protein
MAKRAARAARCDGVANYGRCDDDSARRTVGCRPVFHLLARDLGAALRAVARNAGGDVMFSAAVAIKRARPRPTIHRRGGDRRRLTRALRPRRARTPSSWPGRASAERGPPPSLGLAPTSEEKGCDAGRGLCPSRREGRYQKEPLDWRIRARARNVLRPQAGQDRSLIGPRRRG